MTQITFNLKQEFIDAAAETLGFDNQAEPNLDTKEEYLIKETKQWLKKRARETFLRKATTAARERALLEFETIGD